MDHVSGTKVGITAELLGACSSNSGETSSGNNGMQTEVIRRGGGVPADLPSPELMFSPPDLDSPVFNMGDNVFFGMLARVNPLCTSISQSHDLSLLELEALKHNKHNPIGRFLTENNLTAQEAQELEVVDYLLQAPRTARTKYGTKKNLTPEQKLAQTKARNKAHAAATRERKKLFKKV